MRVVAGKYRGKNLASPMDDSVRPTTTRIKETIFNVLQGYVAGARVLDLFAGSGALGIECISRGAERVDFVDKSRASVELVKQNLKGVDGNYSVRQCDFSVALRSAATEGKKYDLIFLDPPYAGDLAELALDIIFENDLLSADGIAIFEHGAQKTYTLEDPAYKQRTKRMGTVTAEFVSRRHIALMTGSFDPVTIGHEEVLKRALLSFDEVVVACLINPDKTYTFGSAQRLALATAMCGEHKGARAIFSRKTAVEAAAEVGAEKLIRGIRDSADEKYEEEQAAYNRQFGFETEFVVLDSLKGVSSSAVRRQLAEGDTSGLPTAAAEVYASEEFAALAGVELS